ncbi:MAG: transcription antitermination factor NusB [Fervidobacterium sp.]|nr:transcription antitermination factor NusB [Fervidobacterium sp.]
MVSKRRVLREIVVKILFQLDFRPSEFEDILNELSSKIKESKLKTDVERYARGIYERLDELDSIISQQLINWDFQRVSHLERSVLRLGTYELMYEMDVPIEVTLDEMIEISKKYASEESGKFVNGILDKIAKSYAPKEKFNL